VDTQPASPSLLKLFVLAILFIAPLIYLIIALNTGDLLWISPFFNAEPAAMVVHCYGEDVPIQPGSEHFNEINARVQKTLTGRKRWDPLSLSAVTYEEYQSHPTMMVLELFFGSKIRIHSRYKFFSNVDTLIIPLDGRHSQTNAIFGRTNEYISVGSFHVKTTTPLVEYLSEEGLCP
jgi:hypothetical protein